MRARLISENLEFTRGKDSKQALGVGVLRDIVKPKNLVLPVRYEDGAVVDANGVFIVTANREAGWTPLQPSERDDLLKSITKLLNWAYGSSEQVQESYDFKRGIDSKEALDIGKYHNPFQNGDKIHFKEPATLVNDVWYTWNELDKAGITEKDWEHVYSFGDSLIYANGRFQKNPLNPSIPHEFIFNHPEIVEREDYVNENINFERGINSKRSLDVGEVHFNDLKLKNIPEELLDDWRDTTYSGRGIVTTWHKKDGIFTVYRVPESASLEDDLTGYELDEFTIDELILELSAFDEELVYKYNPDTYGWDKL